MAEARTLGLLVVHAKCVRAADEPEWDAWEDAVHLPALCGPDGRVGGDALRAHCASRAGDAGHRVHPRDHPRARRRRRGGAGRAVLAVDDELRATGRMHPAHATIAADVFVAHGRHGDEAGAVGRADRPHPHPRAVHRSGPCRRVGRVVRRRARARHALVRRVLGDVAVAAVHAAARSAPTTSRSTTSPPPTVDEAVARSAVTLAEVVAAGRKHECHTGALR